MCVCVCVCVCVCMCVCVCVCVCVFVLFLFCFFERERERERERQTDRQTDRQRETDRQTYRQRQRERETWITQSGTACYCRMFSKHLMCWKITQQHTSASGEIFMHSTSVYNWHCCEFTCKYPFGVPAHKQQGEHMQGDEVDDEHIASPCWHLSHTNMTTHITHHCWSWLHCITKYFLVTQGVDCKICEKKSTGVPAYTPLLVLFTLHYWILLSNPGYWLQNLWEKEHRSFCFLTQLWIRMTVSLTGTKL